MRHTSWLLAALSVGACTKPADKSAAEKPRVRPRAEQQPSGSPAATAEPTTTPGKAELVLATPTGPVDVTIKQALAQAQTDGKRLIIYVGANDWCEPCRRFHKAVENGELDASFPSVRFLEFNKDRHGEALDAAGYTSRYIPLFAIAGADGRYHGGGHIEGSVGGPGAVANITPRLKKLLAGEPVQ